MGFYNYDKKDLALIVNNFTNISKTNNHLPPQLMKHKYEEHNIYTKKKVKHPLIY